MPAFNPEELAAKIENEANCETSRPPFDPSDYARSFEAHQLEELETFEPSEAPTDTACMQVLSEPSVAPLEDRAAHDLAIALEDTAAPDIRTEEIGREMYSSYLASDFPEALVLAERVLEREPMHAMAQLVADRCKERLRPPAPSNAVPLNPSSVVRLKFAELERQSKHIDARTSFVLGHVDGVTDAGTVAALSGLPPPEALDRLLALLDLGVIEVVA